MSELPSNWASIGLLDISTLVRGVTYTKADASDQVFDGSIPVLRANNIQDNAFDLQDLVHVPTSLVSSTQRVRKGDVVVATSSGSISVVGKAAQASSNMDAGFGAFCGLLRPSDEVNAKYFGHYFSSNAYRTAVSTMARGVNINNLKRDHFEALILPLAPLNEQKRIADKLDAVLARVDACRDRLDRIPAILKRFRQSVVSAATDGVLTRDWRMRNYGSTDRNITTTTLVEQCLQDRVITYGVIKLGDETPQGVPCLRTSNVRWLRIDTEGIKRIAESLSNEYSRTVLKGGEVLVNVRGTLGGVAVATTDMIGWNVSREVAVVPVDQLKINPQFLALWIGAERSQAWLRGVEKGVAYTGINIEDLRTLPLVLPKLEEQVEIVRRVEALFAFADRIEARHAAARAQIERLTPATLAKAFRGELVPQDPNDEPASKLFEKIRTERGDRSESKPKRSRRLPS